MTGKYFLLETRDNSRVTKIFQLILGILCILVALFWVVFNFKSLNTDRRLWITIVFLIGFGLFEILAGLGKTVKYIEISDKKITMKQHSVLPRIELLSSDIEKIEIFPVSIIFKVKNRNRHILRFGLSYTEIISPVREAVTEFAAHNNIALELMEEEI